MLPRENTLRVRVFLTGSRILRLERQDYMGFATRPFSWEQAVEKFECLAAPSAERELRQAIVEAVAHLETIEVHELANLLARVKRSTVEGRKEQR